MEIIRRLERGESHQSVAGWLGRPATGRNRDASKSTEKHLVQAIARFRREPVAGEERCFWTNVTESSSLVEHLMSLFMAWIHPVHVLVDEAKFMKSFRNREDSHCSASLVNAVCAMSCHLLHHGWDDDDDSKAGINTLRSHFMKFVRG